jgi:hypothetical protein
LPESARFAHLGTIDARVASWPPVWCCGVHRLTESGAGDEVIMSITGHVSRAMLSRYSHVRMEAKRRALDEIGARQCAADKKRKKDAERQKQGAVASQPVLVQ